MPEWHEPEPPAELLSGAGGWSFLLVPAKYLPAICCVPAVSYTHLDVYKRQECAAVQHFHKTQLQKDLQGSLHSADLLAGDGGDHLRRVGDVLVKLGLVEVLDSGTFYMSNIELLIGQSSTEAERKRAARIQNKALSAPRTNGGHLSDIRPPEIEIELEKEIDIKREIEKGHPAHAYGRYQNVFLRTGNWQTYRPAFPLYGASISKSCPSTWLLPASGIRAMLPPSGAGPVRMLKKRSHPHATGITA